MTFHLCIPDSSLPFSIWDIVFFVMNFFLCHAAQVILWYQVIERGNRPCENANLSYRIHITCWSGELDGTSCGVGWVLIARGGGDGGRMEYGAAGGGGWRPRCQEVVLMVDRLVALVSQRQWVHILTIIEIELMMEIPILLGPMWRRLLICPNILEKVKSLGNLDEPSSFINGGSYRRSIRDWVGAVLPCFSILNIPSTLTSYCIYLLFEIWGPTISLQVASGRWCA